MSLNIGSISPTAAWGGTVPSAVSPTAGGACSVAYGPVANVCQSSVPVVNMVPVTTVTPLPNMVSPQVSVGQPMGISPWGKGMMSPWGKGMGAMGAGIPGVGCIGILNALFR
jgi:hypothetical protein